MTTRWVEVEGAVGPGPLSAEPVTVTTPPPYVDVTTAAEGDELLLSAGTVVRTTVVRTELLSDEDLEEVDEELVLVVDLVELLVELFVVED